VSGGRPSAVVTMTIKGKTEVVRLLKRAGRFSPKRAKLQKEAKVIVERLRETLVSSILAQNFPTSPYVPEANRIVGLAASTIKRKKGDDRVFIDKGDYAQSFKVVRKTGEDFTGYTVKANSKRHKSPGRSSSHITNAQLSFYLEWGIASHNMPPRPLFSLTRWHYAKTGLPADLRRLGVMARNHIIRGSVV